MRRKRTQRWRRSVLWIACLGAGLSAFWGSIAHAGPGHFAEGNRLFLEGKYPEAEREYRSEVVQSGESVALRFNLGKARELQGDPGGAMLEWERALRLDRGHLPSVRALETARKTVGATVIRESWWVGLEPRGLMGREGWVVAVGAWVLVFSGISVWAWRWRGVALGCALFGAAMAFLGWSWLDARRKEPGLAVVRERSVTVREAPAQPARSLGDLKAGSRVRILRDSAGWVLCVRPEGGEGWILESALERIIPSVAP
ncbi:MAG: hypothetical protein RLZZ244_1299 [Verrucomicrobiota bacterium]